MKFLKEIGDLAGERAAYGNLANDYCSLGVYQKAIEYDGKKIEIAKEVVDRAGEATRYGNLSNAYGAVGDCHKNIEHYEKCLKIAQEIGDRAGEDAGYGNLGNAASSWVIIKKRLSIKKKNRKFQKEPYQAEREMFITTLEMNSFVFNNSKIRQIMLIALWEPLMP